jgi:hypothetical protein
MKKVADKSMTVTIPRKAWSEVFAVILIVITFTTAHGQQVKINGGFVPDSVTIGDHAAFYLTATYPKKLFILFPDTTFSFTPFEFQSKRYFPTRTKDSISYDSTVYLLSTFEVDSVQYLQLPVFILHQQDCTVLQSPLDSVVLKQLVTMPLPDTLRAENLPLKANTDYEPVHWIFNYPLLLIIAGILLLALVVVWVFFGKKIRKHFVAKRLQKEHARFLEAYNQKAQAIQNMFSPQYTEDLLSLWKKYMEMIDSKPYTKLTSKETASLLQNEGLGNQLRQLDSAIYGHNTNVLKPVETLRDHATQRFQQKLQEVTHG